MANILPFEKQVLAVSALAEGNSIRSIERMTGIHRDTIMRLGVRVGMACERLLDEQMRGLPCELIQVDEIWGFIGKKQRAVPEGCENDLNQGDVWTYVALDPESKLVPSFICGKRDFEHTQRFTTDLAARMKNRIQLSTDGMNQYLATVDESFGTDVDYGQIVKVFASEAEDGGSNVRRYSPPVVTGIRKTVVNGDPDPTLICTSHVERQNLTMRMHIRRLTRLTNAFSKKFENFRAAIALHFAYYNYVKVHKTIRCTPCMAAGVTSSLWTVADLIERAA
jgi:IS1 family transposase